MMRTFNIFMAAVLILIGVAACSDRYEIEGFRTQTDRYHLSAAEGKTPVIVYAGGQWKAFLTEQVSWASLDKASGDGLGQVMFSFTENTGLSRKVGVVIDYEGQRDTVVMYQDAGLSSPSIKTAYTQLSLPKCSGQVRTAFATNLGDQASQLNVRVLYPEDVESGWLSEVRIEDDAVSYNVASNVEGQEQRSATVELYIVDADDKTYSASVVVTQTTDEPYITFGVGKYGQNAADVRMSVIDTNMDAYFTNMYEGAEIEFSAPDTPWASVSEEGVISLQKNETGQGRNASLKVSYVDLEGNTWQFLGDFQQSNQSKPAYSFAELKGFVPEASGSFELAEIDGCIEAYVVGDAGPNMDNNPNTNETTIDYTYNYKVNYVQNADATSGLRLLMATKEDNKALKRYGKVLIDLRGLKIVKESNPTRYTLEGLTGESIISQQEGTSVAAKSKTIAQLTDDDIYTYTTLTGLEVAFKSGAWTNCHDGYQRKIKAEEAVNPNGEGINPKGSSAPVVFDATPLLLRDATGKQISMVTNNETPWRRYGQGVKQGTCSFSGIITHHNMLRWAKDGNIGRYSIRIMDESDIVQTSDRFSTVITAWMWDGTFKGKDNISYNFEPSVDTYTTDFNNLSNQSSTSASNAVLYIKKDTGPFWGSSDPTDMSAAPYVQVEFSTTGLSGTNLVFNWTAGGGNQSLSYLCYPADWHIEYSVDGETFTSLGVDYAIHPIVWNSNDTNGKCPLWAVGGLHEYSTNLPSSLLGQTKVYVRIKASTNKCCGKSKPVTDRYAATISSASGGRIRLGEISVEYN